MSRLPCIFAFDLDGTVTTRELLPLMARAAGMDGEIARLTDQTLRGDIPFAASFRRRFAMLADLPLERIHEAVSSVPLDPAISDFIRENRPACALVTGNLDVWIRPLAERLGCLCLSSRSGFRAGKLTLEHILDKGEAVRSLRHRAERIVAIGESVGDVPMFQAADLGIAYAGVHQPVPAILALAQHVARDGEALCRLLRALPVLPARPAPLDAATALG